MAMKEIEERRGREERRLFDLGPPNGWFDRRRKLDRRTTSAEEVELTPDASERMSDGY
jgi:hypothetical protein